MDKFEAKYSEIVQAYSDCNNLFPAEQRNLDFKSEIELTGEELKEVIQLSIPDGYNRFHPVKTIDRILEVFPKASFFVAREGSVCVYVKPNRTVWIGSRGLKEGFAKADEISLEKDGTIRLWWD